MSAGENTDMWRGAVWACALPMALGVMGLAVTLQSLPIGRPSASLIGSPFFMTLPIIVCFIFGTPLAAWLACRRLRKIHDAVKLRTWMTSAWSGLLGATLVHFFAGFIYTAVTAAYLLDSAPDMNAPESDVLLVFFMSAMINGMLWVSLTLPLSLICATIFWRVTKFPKDKTVF